MGTSLRQRYYALLNGTEEFHNENVYVRSVKEDRCVDSAELVIKGLFPKLSTNKEIPIYVDSESEDHLIGNSVPNCPRYQKALNKFLFSSQLIRKEQSFSSLFKYLSKYTGQTVNSIAAASNIYDTLQVEYLDNRT